MENVTKFETQLYKGLAELAVLHALAGDKLYGLALVERINKAGLKISDGTIYPLLHRLEKAELVKSVWDTATPNGRPRKYYTLTAKGKKTSAAQQQAWQIVQENVSALLKGSENG